MTHHQLLTELTRRGLTLALDGTSTLRVGGNTQRLSPTLRDAITAHKRVLLAHVGGDTSTVPPMEEKAPVSAWKARIEDATTFEALETICAEALAAFHDGHIDQASCEGIATACIEQSRTIPPAIPEMLLSEFARAGDWARVHSEILNEEIAFAADNADVHAIPEGTMVYCAAELARLNGVEPEQLKSIHRVKKVFDGEVVERNDSEPLT